MNIIFYPLIQVRTPQRVSIMSALISALVLLVSSTMVITSFNPVYGVVWLVISFVSGASLFWQFGAQFLALLFIVVYVGAIAVLFLFVIMMLPTSLRPLKVDLTRFILVLFVIPIVVLSGGVGVYDLGLGEVGDFGSWEVLTKTPVSSISSLFYGSFNSCFMFCGFVLLSSLIGALVITLEKGFMPIGRRQNLFQQHSR
nr:NADH dehydrogenase subunit 6 [Morbakka sp. MKL-2023]